MITAAKAKIITERQEVKDRANRVVEAIAKDIEKRATIGCRELVIRMDSIMKWVVELITHHIVSQEIYYANQCIENSKERVETQEQNPEK